MCTKNNPAAGFANGTLGRVEQFEPGTGYPVVEVADGRSITIAPMEWAVEEGGKVRAKVTQVPLRLAWAITIHKSQGMSMDQAAMDLSRVRTLKGIHLLGWSEAALSVHPDVGRMDRSFKELSKAARDAFEILQENGEREVMERNFIQAAGGSLAPVKKESKKTTYEETKELILAGNDVDEIAKLRSLTIGTICDHVEKLRTAGEVTEKDLEALVPERLRNAEAEAHAAFQKVGSEKLSPVYLKLKRKYTYDDLRILRLTLRS